MKSGLAFGSSLPWAWSSGLQCPGVCHAPMVFFLLRKRPYKRKLRFLLPILFSHAPWVQAGENTSGEIETSRKDCLLLRSGLGLQQKPNPLHNVGCRTGPSKVRFCPRCQPVGKAGLLRPCPFLRMSSSVGPAALPD